MGSLFRTADAFGVVKVLLCGTTPAPFDRFGRKRSDIAKVALGAEEMVAYEYVPSVLDGIAQLKNEGMAIVAVEQDVRALDYTTFTQMGDTAFVFGDEVRGVSGEVLDRADAIVEIPMRGTKESLNVSVCVGIILAHRLAQA